MLDIKNFINFLENSKNQYFTVFEIESLLKEKGFKKILLSTKWELKEGESYYIVCSGSIFAFKIGYLPQKFNIVASHSDSPCISIKPNPIIIENAYVKLNVDVYGGPILNTWFDKPLGIAGKVGILNEKNEIEFRLFDSEKPIAVIPNLAIHQNSTVNNGLAIDRQKDLLPIIGLSENDIDKEYFKRIIGKKLEVLPEQILSYALYTYVHNSTKLVGIDDEFISSPRLDNLAMVHSSLVSFVESEAKNSVNILAVFDNEEIGSNTINGADSKLFPKILKRISESLGFIGEEFDIITSKSSLISADMAHGVHPNFPEKSDPTNKLKINKGIAIKTSVGKYASSVENTSFFIKLCRENDIDFQHFVNHSNSPGGSTIGPSISANTCISTIDIGAPMLAMHSSVELMGVKDYKALCKTFKSYYNL